MHRNYKNEFLAELRDQQVKFARREIKIEQAERAERLVAEIDPARTYSYEYLCFRITGFRPDVAGLVTMTGEDPRLASGLKS